MVVTTTPLTLSLAIAIGGYFLAGATFLLARGDDAEAILDDFRSRPALAFIAGIVTYVIGAVWVLVHNIWLDPLAIAITLIGWVALVEGLVMIAMPKVLLDFGRALLRPGASRVYGLITLALGAVFLILGLIGRAG